MNLTLGLAFLAGLLSFFSPCVLALVPVYVSYITGRSVTNISASDNKPISHTLAHGLTFILGFSIVFVLMGLVFSAIGNLLFQAQDILEKIGGIIVVLFGLHLTGILRIPFLEHELKPRSGIEKNRGFISSFLLGVFFSAGWSPCIGPILGAILVIAMNEGDTTKGALLLSSYSLGMAIPFLIASVFIGWLTKLIKKYKKMMRVIEILTGVLLIFVGILLFFGMFDKLSGYGSLIQFGI